MLKRGASPNSRDSSGQTPLIIAAGNEDPESIRTLLKAGAKVNLKDRMGRTALANAAKYGLGRYDLNDFVSQGDISKRYPIVEVFRLLLAARADPNRSDHEGVTPLMFAAGYAQSPECVMLLLKHGARVNSRTKYRWTALDYARRLSEPDIPDHDNKRVISMLKTAGGRGSMWPAVEMSKRRSNRRTP